jgi:hypothetical protein
MPSITFKAKVEPVYNADDTLAYQIVKVPEIKRAHCDMPSFRVSAKFGAYANSDLFLNLIKRALKNAGIGQYVRLDNLPPCVRADSASFLTKVTIEL